VNREEKVINVAFYSREHGKTAIVRIAVATELRFTVAIAIAKFLLRSLPTTPL
jgi:hypothetical protein